jgi:hypothetical protein
VMPTILFSWVMLSIVVGVAADSRGRNPAWVLLALMISPLLAALLLLALPNLKTKRQWQPYIEAVIDWFRGRPCNSKGGARMSTFATGAPDRIDYWIRRRVLQYWDDTHPFQRKLNPGRDRRVQSWSGPIAHLWLAEAIAAMAATNKSLAHSNKSRTGGEAPKKREIGNQASSANRW